MVVKKVIVNTPSTRKDGITIMTGNGKKPWPEEQCNFRRFKEKRKSTEEESVLRD